jgi:3-hydroxymyristoyl/3-hydroxydecanoyl-(acyl carrier protein) dehydratase
MTDHSTQMPVLPHRAPFRLLDRIVEATAERGVGVKLVSAGDPCVTPNGVLPTAFVIEALAQCGGAYLNALGGDGTHAGLLAQIEGFASFEPVRVGDELRIEVRLVRRFRTATVLEGRALVDDRVCAEGRFVLVAGD